MSLYLNRIKYKGTSPTMASSSGVINNAMYDGLEFYDYEYQPTPPSPVYTPVSYIKTVSTSLNVDDQLYIYNSGINFSQIQSGNVQFEVEFYGIGTNGSRYFGQFYPENGTRFFMPYNNTIMLDIGTKRASASFSCLQYCYLKLEYDQTNNTAYIYNLVNGNLIKSMNYSNLNYNGYFYADLCRMKLKSMKAIVNGTITFNAIAAIDENNLPCLYDSVSNSLIYNSGSGSDSGLTYEA